jgi:phenylacetate-CoA ligase
MSHEQLPQIGDWSSFDELRSMQDQCIPGVLARAARSPFYAQRFADGGRPASLEDFGTIPLTTKRDLVQSYPFGMLAVPQSELATYFETSGTSGAPTPAYYTQPDWRDLVERYARKSTGIDPSDIFFVRSPYALGMAAHLAHQSGRFRGATIIPGDRGSSVMPYARVVRVLHDLGVTLAWSNPTDCLLWAAAALRAGLDPGRDFPALRALFVGGEPLSVARRRRISEIWGVPVVDEYGCSEVGSVAGRCAADTLHLWADRMKPEVYDERSGTVQPAGVGELVLTPLYLEAMPLVRYNVHDRVELSYEDCECGWKLPIVTVLGRAGQGYPVGDSRITQLDVEELVFSLPAELGVLFWRARAQPDRLHIQIEAADINAQPAEAALHDAIHDELGVPCEVEVLSPGGLVPDDVLASPRQSLKPRPLYGPDESWEQAIVASAS